MKDPVLEQIDSELKNFFAHATPAQIKKLQDDFDETTAEWEKNNGGMTE